MRWLGPLFGGVVLSIGSLALTTLAAAPAPTPAPERPLRVCLEASSPPFSVRAGPDRGIDHHLAQSVAEALGRPLVVHWFEASEASEADERPLPLQVNELLSRDVCELVAGYPLVRESLGEPGVPTLRTPGREGATSPVRLHRLIASAPYLSLPLTLVSRAGAPAIERLEDVVGSRLVVERDTLASAIATAFLAARAPTPIARVAFETDALFDVLERGEADVALVERHRFEIYRARVPATRLHAGHYRHPLAVNTGFVGIAPALIERVDAVLRRALETGEVAALVEAQGLSHAAPSMPAVLPPLTPRVLARP